MKQVTRWSPDTCACVFEYEWDDALEGSDRIHSFKRVVKLCPEHERLGFQGKAAFDKVMEENTGKNIAWREIMGELNLTHEDLNKYVWFFDESRQLQASVTLELTTEKKQALQGRLNTVLGAGKAKVV